MENIATTPEILHRPARYALRRTLPPWCFQQRLEELLEFCRLTHTEEVILKVDTEEFSHGLPTIAWLEQYLPLLARARDALGAIGVRFSLNPWVTMGHLDRGRDLRQQFPQVRWMVGHDGRRCRACACPLSPAWRQHTRKLWRMYASLKPHVIWIEDDIRTFNHMPVRFGCFCRLHLEVFGRLVGERVTRQQLLKALLKPGPPHPWRKKWLDLQQNVILDVCEMLASTVREVSPDTFVGLMSSGPENHCLEGRNWRKLAKILAGPRPIYSRPTLGNYSENSLRGLYYSAAQIKRTRFVLPAETFEQTEVENFPFTEYSKSTTFTFLQIAVSAAHGCHGVTMNLFDHMGTPMSINPDMQRMLADNRPFIDALCESHCPAGVFRGVRILHHEKASYVRQLSPGDDYEQLAPNDYAWEYVLNALGITTTYTDSPVIAADGQMIAAYSDDEIHAMLSGGMLLDLSAAETLIARGFRRHLGIAIDSSAGLHDSQAISAEQLTDEAFGGGQQRYLTMTIPDLTGSPRFGVLKPDRSARIVSQLIDPDRKVVCSFLTLFENELGGRVAVLPLEMRQAIGPGFLHPYRREQLLATLQWLSHGRLPAAVAGGAYPLAYRMDLPGWLMLGVFNLSLDDWPEISWEIHLPTGMPRGTEVLGDDGRWRDAHAQYESPCSERLRLTVAGPLSFRRPVILRVRLNAKQLRG